MKKVILFIAAAVVSVATLQAQNLDAILSIIPEELKLQEAAPAEEPVVEAEESAAAVEETTVEETAVVKEFTVADVANSILPGDFSYETLATKSTSLAYVTPSEQITSYAEYAKSTKTRFLPMRQRVDRNIGDNKFVYKGECMLGLTASYGNITTDGSDLMLLLDDINIGLRTTTIRPFFAYAYRDNMAVGIRLGYQFIDGSLGNIGVNLGLIAEGMENINISDLGLRNESFSWAIFHRNYLGLDRRGIVGVIIESELLVKSGNTLFTSGKEVVNASRSGNFAAQLNVNPGLGIYIFPQVCVTATVGIGGLRYNCVRQYDAAGEIIGRRDQSSLNFKINITDIQIGVVAHLWNNKK